MRGVGGGQGRIVTIAQQQSIAVLKNCADVRPILAEETLAAFHTMPNLGLSVTFIKTYATCSRCGLRPVIRLSGSHSQPNIKLLYQ